LDLAGLSDRVFYPEKIRLETYLTIAPGQGKHHCRFAGYCCIADSLATAEKARAEMAQFKSENEALLAKAREERGQILKEARDTKDKIINEAKEQAKAEANKIISDAQAAIHQQKMAALTDVKNQIGQLVIEVSQKVLRRELGNSAEQENYIKQLTNEVKLN